MCINLYYFDSKKYGEIDFVIQNGMSVDLLEIKSGEDYKVHCSLNKVISVKEWTFKNKYVFCKGNIEKDHDIVYMPWYMIMFYQRDYFRKKMIHQADISHL